MLFRYLDDIFPPTNKKNQQPILSSPSSLCSHLHYPPFQGLRRVDTVDNYLVEIFTFVMKQRVPLLLSLLLGISVVMSEAFSVVPNRNLMVSLSLSSSSVPTLSMIRGGSGSGAAAAAATTTIPGTPLFASMSPIPSESSKVKGWNKALATFGSIWGTGGVLYILGKAIFRVLPIALEPLKKDTTMILTSFQWGAYALTCVFFAYYEGYKGFQTKFAPLVVKRSCSLVPGTPQATFLNYLLAPFYSMALMFSTKKRKIVSWSVSLGVAGIVAAVKRLAAPWRNIVDAGVVVGLSWGALSILVLYIQAWVTGQPPEVDACLPELKDKKA